MPDQPVEAHHRHLSQHALILIVTVKLLFNAKQNHFVVKF